MKYPNIKPRQGENQTPQRYPSDSIELAGPPNALAKKKDQYVEPGKNAAINDSQPKNRPPVK